VPAGGIDADVKMRMRMFLGQFLQSRVEFLITFGGLGEVERFGSGPFLLIQKRNMMPIAGGVDSDAQGYGRSRVVFHGNLRVREKSKTVVMSFLHRFFDRKRS
jgi:hypothetical protein